MSEPEGEEVQDLRERFERYASGGEGIDDLAAECGVSGPTLRKRFQEAGYLTPGGVGSRKAYLRRGWSWQDDFWTGEKIIYEDDPAKFVVEGPAGTKATLGELARRNANGETMNSLAAELGIVPTTLWNYLRGTGLIPSPEERQRERRAAALKEVPDDLHNAIVQRYEAGMAVNRIVEFLCRRGLPAKVDWVESVLDHHRIIRHSKAGEVPVGAPQGISSTPEAQAIELQDSPVDRKAEPHWFDPSMLKPEPLSKQRLEGLAERHAEGGGEPIRILAAREGIDEAELRRALQEAGYVVSTYSEWLRRTREG